MLIAGHPKPKSNSVIIAVPCSWAGRSRILLHAGTRESSINIDSVDFCIAPKTTLPGFRYRMTNQLVGKSIACAEMVSGSALMASVDNFNVHATATLMIAPPTSKASRNSSSLIGGPRRLIALMHSALPLCALSLSLYFQALLIVRRRAAITRKMHTALIISWQSVAR